VILHTVQYELQQIGYKLSCNKVPTPADYSRPLVAFQLIVLFSSIRSSTVQHFSSRASKCPWTQWRIAFTLSCKNSCMKVQFTRSLALRHEILHNCEEALTTWHTSKNEDRVFFSSRTGFLPKASHLSWPQQSLDSVEEQSRNSSQRVPLHPNSTELFPETDVPASNICKLYCRPVYKEGNKAERKQDWPQATWSLVSLLSQRMLQLQTLVQVACALVPSAHEESQSLVAHTVSWGRRTTRRRKKTWSEHESSFPLLESLSLASLYRRLQSAISYL